MYKTTTDNVGAKLYPKGKTVNIRKAPGTDKPILATVASGSVAGTFNGKTFTPKAGYPWWGVKTAKGEGWVRTDVVTPFLPGAAVKAGDGKALLESILQRDFATFHAAVVCRALIEGLAKKKVKTQTYQAQLDTIIRSYNARQAKIRDSKLVKANQGISKRFQKLYHDLWFYSKGLKPPTISAVPLAAPYVVGGLVLLGTAVAIYNLFKNDAKAAEIDLSKAGELKKLLEKAAPEVKTKVLKEIQDYGQQELDRGTASGKAAGFFGGLDTAIKAGAILIVVYAGSQMFSGKSRERRAKR